MSPAVAERDTGPATRGARLLVVDDDADMRELLREELEDAGYLVEVAPGGRAAVERVRAGGVDLLVSDVRMPDLDGLDLLREIRQVPDRPYVITITAFGSIDTAIRAVKLGAYDYITKPFELRELLAAIDKALAERAHRRAGGGSGLIPLAAVSGVLASDGAGADARAGEPAIARTEQLGALFGRSRAMREIMELLRRLRDSSAGVLIAGEPGTGKELIARTLHGLGPRGDRPFVVVSCAALPEAALDAELFGPASGARVGAFAEAHGGTLLLDEVDALPAPLQVKVLRVLQDRVLPPRAGAPAAPMTARVIATCHRDLEAELRAGRLREDLYYRLNVVELRVPPLRERVDDILPLAEQFLARAAREAGKPARGLHEEVRKLLCAYAFPGNVRELENIIQHAVALSRGPMITVDDLPAALRDRRNQDRLADALAQGLTLGELERAYIERVLEAEGGNKTRAALRLGVDRRTLYRKLEEWAAGEPATGDRAPDDDRGGKA